VRAQYKKIQNSEKKAHTTSSSCSKLSFFNNDRQYFLTITASYLHQTEKKENPKKEKERQTNKPYIMIATMRRESKLVANAVTILPSFLPSFLLLFLSL
jgi:hypothetical protein